MKYIIIAFVFFSTYINSQVHRFIYDVEYKKDSLSDVLTKENYHLDISPNEVEYYTRDFFVADSLIINDIPFPKNTKLNTSTIVSHKTGSNDYSEYDLIENTVLKLQTTDSQIWKLTDEKKKIKDLTLQKATTHWGGRNWTVWFTTEIPFQEGPYKFHGLPGLIIEVFDDKGNYKIQLVKSEKKEKKVQNQFIQMSKQMSASVTWEKYKNTKLKYYDSPVSFIKNSVGSSNNDQFFLNDGTKVNPSNMREINERLRNNIKKYNNPIDLTKAIQY
ncbi:hypothetical protein ACM39_12675 [Chryseobacterium sp. FH2]|uniref:GLPGLI family protein n=1 Tax=Chryseobacterium sp. FH2 TaxID=1674291 RepID=UPI00065AE2E6|nr:GLPGLI family protein [Chryseobacterium sp. FH2]KMQ67702.1 hypothetical protein ACM39_12675 [Chryseobacterium sp. FH2]